MTTKKTTKTTAKMAASKQGGSKTATGKAPASKTAKTPASKTAKTPASKTAKTPASKTAAAATTRKTTRTKTEAPMVVGVRRQPSYLDIAERAYALYQARGYAHGHHLQDWLQAEQEVYGELHQGR